VWFFFFSSEIFLKLNFEKKNVETILFLLQEFGQKSKSILMFLQFLQLRCNFCQSVFYSSYIMNNCMFLLSCLVFYLALYYISYHNIIILNRTFFVANSTVLPMLNYSAAKRAYVDILVENLNYIHLNNNWHRIFLVQLSNSSQIHRSQPLVGNDSIYSRYHFRHSLKQELIVYDVACVYRQHHTQ
jgi:hypothetical protein